MTRPNPPIPQEVIANEVGQATAVIHREPTSERPGLPVICRDCGDELAPVDLEIGAGLCGICDPAWGQGGMNK